jgi:hypothetical protein
MGDTSTVTVRTNNVPRPVLDASDLTPTERAEFDYLDWDALEAGNDSASFFRYRGTAYDLGEFTADYGLAKGIGLPEHLSKWDAYMSVHAFCAIVVRYVDDFDAVVVGRVLS